MISHVSVGVRDIAKAGRFTMRRWPRSDTSAFTIARRRWGMARTVPSYG